MKKKIIDEIYRVTLDLLINKFRALAAHKISELMMC